MCCLRAMSGPFSAKRKVSTEPGQLQLTSVLGVVCGIALAAALTYGIDGQLYGTVNYLLVPRTEVAGIILLLLAGSAVAGFYLGHVAAKLPGFGESRLAD
jgi:hypothetical protein